MNIDGMKNGDFKTYHSNGELWKISLYTNDKEIVKENHIM
jgi:antitoxin component YwqK of YwqJK toxin-antitoxin module